MGNSKSGLAAHHMAMLITSIMYAANYSIAKMLMPHAISPYALVLIRLIGASLILFPILWMMKGMRPDWRKDGLLFFWCAMTGVVINMLLFFKGLSLSMALDAAIIMTLTPPATYLIAVVSGQDSISARKIGGVLLAFIGVYALITKFTMKVPEVNLGNLLLLINAVAYAFYIPGVKKLGRTYDPITICAWTFIMGLPVVSVFGFGDLVAVQWSIFTNAQWAALTFVVMGVTVISYLLISFSSKKLPAASVAFYSYLQPVIAIAIAIMFYGERLTLMHLFAGALILLGLWLLNMENKKRNVYA